jgi:predicted ATPase
MITLVTGFNKTGKSDWIENQITPKIFAYIKEFGHFGNDDKAISEEMKDMFYHNTLHSISSVSIKYLCNRPLKGIPFYLDYPENGLHPSLQSKLVEQFIKLHNEGYELYIETHSDHILYNLLISCKKYEDGIIIDSLNKDFFKILYFNRIDIQEIKVEKGGKIRKFPKGFFDFHRDYIRQLL